MPIPSIKPREENAVLSCGKTLPTKACGITPTLEEVTEIAAMGAYRRIPVRSELYADQFTPVEAFRAARTVSDRCFLLESAEPNRSWGRYSFVGFGPTARIVCRDGELEITRDIAGASSVERQHVEHPNESIRAFLAEHASPALEGFPPFSGGLVGYFSFDYLKYAEPALQHAGIRQGGFPDVDLMAFDTLVAIDSYTQKAHIIASVDALNVNESYRQAEQEIERVRTLLKSGVRHDFQPLAFKGNLAPRYSKGQFIEMVESAKDHIREGDIFQVVLSNPLTAPAEGSLFDAYRALRCTNPSPYMAFISDGDAEIAVASPETLVRLENGVMCTCPLAGTRPRGATEADDIKAEEELRADEKELAEHNMLVDLGRNDIGRVAELGSVRVDRYLDVLRFSHVMHLGSTVRGKLAKGKDALDLIESALPAGTLSGAPKIRACQIIQSLEKERRGVYGGALGYIDFSGNMDVCISIRLACKSGGVVSVQSGAGIVADSVPEHEFAECRNKAGAVIEALQKAEGGLR